MSSEREASLRIHTETIFQVTDKSHINMLFTIQTKEVREEMVNVGFPSYYRQTDSIDPFFAALLDEHTMAKVSDFSVHILCRVNVSCWLQDILSNYLPITEEEFYNAYNKAQKRISDCVIPISKKKA
jgi:hypothetical protein